MKKLINVALDVDDVLLQCNEYAVKLANKKYHFSPPLSLNEINKWGKRNDRSDIIFEYFQDPDFWATQPVIQGAKEFVKELSKIANVFITSAVIPEYMSVRAIRILELFPEIPAENIILGARKDVYNFDIILDDGGHNIINSRATYPILLRRPWNTDLTGLLSVNNLEEALFMIKTIINCNYQYINPSEANIIAFVGPSGSGKNEIIKELEKEGKYKKPFGYTTCKENKKNYTVVSKEEFLNKTNLLETTVYAGEMYGIEKDSIDAIINAGNTVVLAVDICGAMGLKKEYPKTLMVYVKTDKRVLIENILNKNISQDEKINRILSISDEKKNEDLCDLTITNISDLTTALKKEKN